MDNKLAILVPVFNGGPGLIETILSCSNARLSPDQYEIIVVDNCSTDRSTETLPDKDINGAHIRLFKNDSNIGRVGNFNRAIEIAERNKFDFLTFLFVEDKWIPNSSIPYLLKLMVDENASMGMASLRMVNEDDKLICLAKRFSIRGESSVIPKESLLKKTISIGHLAYGPAQANVYRIYPKNKLRFDPTEPMTTDQEATVKFLSNSDDPVVFAAKPYMQWKAHKGRKFMRENPVYLIKDTMILLRKLSEITKIQVQWREANSVILLSSMSAVRNFHKARLALFYSVIQYMMKQSGFLSPTMLLKISFMKLIFKRSIVSLDQ